VLDNEPVYAGQPLSYWRVEFGKESRLSSSLLTDDIAWQQTIDPAAVPLLVELLKDQNEYARARAAICLGKLGPRHRPVSTFDRSLTRSLKLVRIQVMTPWVQLALRKRGNQPSQGIAKGGRSALRLHAGQATWQVSGEADAVLPIFLELLKKKT